MESPVVLPVEEISADSLWTLEQLLLPPVISDETESNLRKRLGAWKIESKRGRDIFIALTDPSPERHKLAFGYVRHYMDGIGKCRNLLECVARWYVFDPLVAERRLKSLINYMSENNLVLPMLEFMCVRALIYKAPSRSLELMPMLNRIK